MPKVSVITPTVGRVKTLKTLLNDFRNQTYKDFEHILVYDGRPPEDVMLFMHDRSSTFHPATKFVWIEKDPGNMSIAPGTRPRNHGTIIATGEYVIYADDDDRYKDTFLEVLASGVKDDVIHVVQMSCTEYRQSLGDPTRVKLIPEVGLPQFPMVCHIGTPCFIVPRKWALEEPWREEPNHDFQFIKRICERYHPRIRIIPGMQVDVDGKVIGNMKDWVSQPPFYREEVLCT